MILINTAYFFVMLCETRRLNNNSLYGPFPVFLSKIPQLAFLWVWVSSVSHFLFWLVKVFIFKIWSMGFVHVIHVYSETCLITISVDQCLKPQPGPSSMVTLPLSLSLLCCQLLYFPWFCFCFTFFLSSIVGNPLICGSSTNQGCFGSVTLVPPSSFIESSSGNTLNPPPLVLDHLFLSLLHFFG